MSFLPRKQLLSYEEITRVATAFANLGVNKIRITGGEPLTRQGIELLFKNLGQLEPITNDDEIIPLVNYAIENNMDISFIEEMPLGTVDHNRADSYCSSADILATIATEFKMHAVDETTGGPSRYHALEGSTTRVGVISPHSNNFCTSCNRVRLTSEGRLLLCLGQEHSLDLKALLRDGCSDLELENAIFDSMARKPEGHDFTLQAQPVILRHMSATGG